jgi:ABC-2 type transport system permease protein
MSEEIRTGTMAMRLLRPIHPFVAFGSMHLSAVPFRSVMALPIAIILLFSSGADALVTDPIQLALAVPSIAMAWLITFSLQYTLGCLAFWLTQAGAVVNLYFGAFSVLSGYLVPLDLLPGWIARAAGYTPFPSMLATPVTMLTRELSAGELATVLGTQLAWATGVVVLALAVWRMGVRRFEAVGA